MIFQRILKIKHHLPLKSEKMVFVRKMLYRIYMSFQTELVASTADLNNITVISFWFLRQFYCCPGIGRYCSCKVYILTFQLPLRQYSASLYINRCLYPFNICNVEIWINNNMCKTGFCRIRLNTGVNKTVILQSKKK